jgi:SAM-dependent methyltransferase
MPQEELCHDQHPTISNLTQGYTVTSSVPQALIDAATTYETLFVPALFRQSPIVADAAKIKGGDRVLDIACGTGVLARESAARTGQSGRVAGLDWTMRRLSGIHETLGATRGKGQCFCTAYFGSFLPAAEAGTIKIERHAGDERWHEHYVHEAECFLEARAMRDRIANPKD